MERIKLKRESARRGCCQTQVVAGEISPDVKHRTQEVIIHVRFRKHDLERRMFALSSKTELEKGHGSNIPTHDRV